MRVFGLKRLVLLILIAMCGRSVVPGFAFADDRGKSQPPSEPGVAKTEDHTTTGSTDGSEPVLQRARLTSAPSSGIAERESGTDHGALEQARQASANNDPPVRSEQELERRALPAALDGVFPSSEYLGPTPLIGVPDTDPVYPLTKAVWAMAPALKDARIKVYGWVNPGISVSTSNKSNIPDSYAIVPNRLELDQAVIRIERLPNTVQTDHVDWGFRLTPMYGIDYRWTTSQGWFSGQLLNHNRLYGFDPVEAYALLYIPHVAQGMVIKAGRYISPPDIEAHHGRYSRGR